MKLPASILAAALTASAPAAPSATYVVASAPRNPAVNNMQASYRPDDPQLVGRLVRLEGRTIIFDGGAIECPGPVRTDGAIRSGTLFRAMFPDQYAYQHRYVARPTTFGIRLPPDSPVRVVRLHCHLSGPGKPPLFSAALLTLPDGRRALWLKDIEDHLMILRPAAGPIRAGFNCARARSPSERTICGERLLAGWDRSVAAAFRLGKVDSDEQRA